MKFWCMVTLALAGLALVNAGLVPSYGVVVVDNIDKYVQENNLEVTEKLTSFTKLNVTSRLYRVGTHTAGEMLVGTGHQRLSYNTLHAIKVTLTWPSNGVPQGRITCIEVSVDQTYANEQVYLLSGGPGYGFAQVVIEAPSTYFLEYTTNIYGFK